MKVWIVSFLSYGLLMSNALATPKKIYIYFLSPVKTSYLPQTPQIQWSKKLAQNKTDDEFMKNCQPMGDGCFHPQLGFVANKVEVSEPSLLKPEENLKTFNAIETSVVDCNKDYHFDIFCGKTKSESVWNGDMEVWFDVSSSLREVDFSTDKETCQRRSFFEKLQKQCGKSLRVATYNTNIKELGDHSNICMSYGTNDEKKLMEWIKASQANKLVIVTDIDELSRPFQDFLSAEGATFVGDGVKAYTAKNLVDDVGEFAKICRK